jgi:hypothetical protein
MMKSSCPARRAAAHQEATTDANRPEMKPTAASDPRITNGLVLARSSSGVSHAV